MNKTISTSYRFRINPGLFTLLLCLLLLMQGCAASYKYTEKFEAQRFNDGRYLATRMDAKVVAGAFNSSSSNWFRGVAVVMAPLAIIDMPISLVFDTLTLPYDYYMHVQYKNDRKYWQQQFDSAEQLDIDKPAHREHYTEAGRYWLSQQFRLAEHYSRKLNESQLKLLFNLSANGSGERNRQILENTVRLANEDNELSDELCSRVVGNPDEPNNKLIIYNLFRVYTSNITGGYDVPTLSRQCVSRLADAGIDCDLLLRSPHLHRKHIERCFAESPARYISKLARNPATPLDIHEEIYASLFSGATTIDEMGLRDKQGLRYFAGNIRNPVMIAKLIEVNHRYLDRWLLKNPELTPEQRNLINERANKKAGT